MTNLPPGWVRASIDEIAEVQGGIQKQPKRQPRENAAPFLRVANVLRGRLDLENVHSVELFNGELERYSLRYGDLLVVEGNGSPEQIGRAAMWRGEIPDAVHQNHLIRIRPTSAVLPKYLTLAWNSPDITGQLRDVASSTSGLYTLSTSKIKSITVPVPPMQEQERIVVTLDDHLSRLDAATGLARTAKHRADRLAVRYTDHLVSLTSARTTTLSKVLREPLVNGRSVPTEVGGFPVLRLTALRDGRLDLTERKGGRWTSDEAARYRVRRGDFFVSRGNGSLDLVGRGALLEEEPDEVAFPDTMIRIRVDEKVLHRQFLRLVWNSRIVREQIERTARTTAGIYKVNQQILESIIMPLPDLATQEALATEAEWMSSITIPGGAAVEDTLTKAERLRRSLLRDAFAGRLAAGDREDEPASVLLERLQQERAAQPNPQRGRRTASGRQKETLL